MSQFEMKTAAQVLEAFDNIRRAQRAGVYAPHKPLLILLAPARVQRDEPRLVEFAAIDGSLQALQAEFGPSGAPKSRHYPFWHLATDGQGALWDLNGPRELLTRPAGATPNLGELRTNHVQGGFPPEVDGHGRSPMLAVTRIRPDRIVDCRRCASAGSTAEGPPDTEAVEDVQPRLRGRAD